MINVARLMAVARNRVGLAASISLLILLTACVAANTTALEPQNQSLDARQARLYFMRHANAVASVMSYPTVTIKVDGKPVGGLATGAYIFVDRPAGAHAINVAGSSHDKSGFETDIQVQAGGSYYFEIGPIVRESGPRVQTAADGLMKGAMEVSGRPLTGRYGTYSGFMFYALDAAAGAAAIAALDSKR